MGLISNWKAKRAAKKAKRAAKKSTSSPTAMTSAQQSSYSSIVSTAQQQSAAPSQATTVTKIATSNGGSSNSGGSSSGGSSGATITPSQQMSTIETPTTSASIISPASSIPSTGSSTPYEAQKQKTITAASSTTSNTGKLRGAIQPTRYDKSVTSIQQLDSSDSRMMNTGFGDIDFNSKQDSDFTPASQGTSSYIPPKLDFDIKTEPYIEKRTTRYWTSPSGKDIPITENIYVDPLAPGKQFERPATTEETKMLEDQRKMLSFETGTASATVSTGDKLRQAGKDVEKYLGIDLSRESLGTQSRERIISEDKIGKINSFIGDNFYGGGKVGKVTAGIVTGLIPQTKAQLGLTAVSFGIGTGVGVGVKGVSTAAKLIPKYGVAASSVINTGALVGGLALTGGYVYKTGVQIKATEEYLDKGEIIGNAARDFLAMGAGYGAGSKLFTIGRGKYITRGRTKIDIESLVPENVLSGKQNFPTAPSSQHLSLFEGTTTKFPQLTEGKPGGFHTTPTKFWKGTLEGSKGTSELPGTYVG